MARARSAVLLTAIAALLLLAGPVLAQRDADVDEAGRVVLQQLEAFRRDDFATAYTFASRTIHDMFDPARFEAMVRGGYPEIARSVRANIDGSKHGDGGELYLFLHVQGDNGRVIEAVYELVRENGAWRINGVVTRPDTSEKA